jgi:serine/threonine protein kinase
LDRELAQGLIRRVLPSYEIGALLGEGSSGAVFLIRDSLKERAVKIVPLSASAAVAQGSVVSATNRIERDFRHIVESYERLACDEIVTVYDFHRIDVGGDARSASAYAIVVMELYPDNLHGYVLDRYEKSGAPLPAAAAQGLIEKLARMLEDLSTRRGFLFEDIKPENILVKETHGEAKLVVGDIGGLKNLGSVSTSSTQVTLTYCAPETLRLGKRPDLRSTVYSFGLLAFFILEGHLPYDQAGAVERIDLLRERGVPLERTDVPQHLRDILARCLAHEPEQRYGSFQEILDAIRNPAAVRADRFSGDTVDLSSFVRSQAPAAGAAPAAPAPAASASSRSSGIAPVSLSTSLPHGGRPAAPPAPQPPSGPVRPPLPPGLQFGLRGVGAAHGGGAPGQRRVLASARTNEERDACEKATREIRGLVVRRDDVQKITEDSRVFDDIVVEPDAILVIENARLFFAEQAGILSQGTIRAKNSTFTALDPVRRWKNCAFNPASPRASVVEGCTFRFGRGRAWAECREAWQLPPGDLNDTFAYGGGMFLLGGQETGFTVQGTTFTKCSAQEGGGLAVVGSRLSIETCVFESCTATLSGGGLACRTAAAKVRNSRFLACSAEKGGGGLACIGAPPPAIDGCAFETCTTRYLYGGGVICNNVSPLVHRCKFTRCSASKDGGGIWWDETSAPRVLAPNYVACAPTNQKTQTR